MIFPLTDATSSGKQYKLIKQLIKYNWVNQPVVVSCSIIPAAAIQKVSAVDTKRQAKP